NRHRKGAVTPLVAILMVFLLAMVAFGVDLGYIAVSQKEVQNAADSAALAGTSQLLDRGRLKGTPNQALAISNARTAAQQFSVKNTGGGVALQLDTNASNDTTGDLVCGYLVTPSDLSSSLDTSAANYNSVQARVRRTAAQNGALKLFFGSVIGRSTQDLTAKATATYEGGFGVTGFKFTGTSATTAPLLPFTLDINAWNNVLSGNGPDDYAYDPVAQKVSSGSDGIHEFNLFPQKGISSGNMGTVDLGSPNNSTADISRQIRYGLNAYDLSFFPNNQIVLGQNGTLSVQGDTGVSAGFKDDLAAIIGQKRIIPIYQPPTTGSGNNTTYTIVAFGGISILDVSLTGLDKKLIVQPEYVITQTVITNGSNGGTNSFIYKPLKLTR
ncbi:MAG TPA: TadE/TadG family type IV pilus assembly protein, partial [Gemmataceae bacterium]|nr:TadE/TadG family type IV pilus assembly protein [Gemmataceae bacterium]